eukprot:scaffold22679_cov69-Phaeocystis_antarctica.AAC.3
MPTDETWCHELHLTRHAKALHGNRHGARRAAVAGAYRGMNQSRVSLAHPQRFEIERVGLDEDTGPVEASLIHQRV